MENSEKQIIITPENINNVVIKDVVVTKKCSTSFDQPLDDEGNKLSKEWKDEHPGYNESHKVTFNFRGSALKDVLDDASARLVIKAQSRIRAKGATAEHMAEYLDKQDRNVEFNYAELQGRQQLSAEEKASRLVKEMDSSQLAALKAQIEAMEQNG